MERVLKLSKKIETLFVPDEIFMKTILDYAHTQNHIPCSTFASRVWILNLDYRFSHATHSVSTNTWNTHTQVTSIHVVHTYNLYLNCLPWKIFGCYFYFMQLLLHVFLFFCFLCLCALLLDISSIDGPNSTYNTLTHTHTYTHRLAPHGVTLSPLSWVLLPSFENNIRFTRC